MVIAGVGPTCDGLSVEAVEISMSEVSRGTQARIADTWWLVPALGPGVSPAPFKTWIQEIGKQKHQPAGRSNNARMDGEMLGH